MNYYINVSQYGKHLFATKSRGMMRKDADILHALMKLKFPENEGYRVELIEEYQRFLTVAV